MWRCPSRHAKVSLWGSSWFTDRGVLSCRGCSLSVCWADGVECWARVNKQPSSVDVFQVTESRVQGSGAGVICGSAGFVGKLILVKAKWKVSFDMLQYWTFHALHDHWGQGHRPVMAEVLSKRFMMAVVCLWFADWHISALCLVLHPMVLMQDLQNMVQLENEWLVMLRWCQQCVLCLLAILKVREGVKLTQERSVSRARD